MAVRSITVAALLLLSIGISRPALAQRVAEETSITAEGGARFSVARDWTVARDGDVTRVTAPEGDLFFALVPVPAARSAAEAAEMAWRRLDPGFARKVELVTEGTPLNGWEAQTDVAYLTSPAEARSVRAIALKKGEAWTVLLFDGADATVSKRLAALRLATESLTAPGYVAENFAARTPHKLDAARIASIRDYVEQSIAALGVPGAGYALLQDGKIVFAGGAGVRALGHPAPVDENTLFMIASNTKGMTTLLIAKLIEMGKISLDDRVVDLYPMFRLGSEETTRSVLVRHLVCACTGLPRKDLEWIFPATRDTPAAQVFQDLAETEPTSGFGEVYQYSNALAAAAGYIAGHILYPDMEIGAAYRRAMQEHVFGPLAMNATTLSLEAALGANHAAPHGLNFAGQPESIEQSADFGFNHTVAHLLPTGGAWSSARDMAQYVGNELRAGMSSDGRRLFAAEPLLARRSRMITTGKDKWYGMGLETAIMSGLTVIDHGGSMAGYKSNIVIIPEANVAAVMLTNGDEGYPVANNLARKLIETLYDAEPRALRQVQADAASTRAALAKQAGALVQPLSAATRGRLGATYTHPELGKIVISTEGERTYLRAGSWRSALAERRNPDGTTSLVMTTPGMLGADAQIMEEGGKRLLRVTGGQHRYDLVETTAVSTR